MANIDNMYGLSSAEYQMAMLRIKKQREEEQRAERQARIKRATSIGKDAYSSYLTSRAGKVKRLLEQTGPAGLPKYQRIEMPWYKEMSPLLKPESMVAESRAGVDKLVSGIDKFSIQPSLPKPSPLPVGGTSVSGGAPGLEVAWPIDSPMSISAPPTISSANLKPVDVRGSLPSGPTGVAAPGKVPAAGPSALSRGLGALGAGMGIYEMTRPDFHGRSSGYKALTTIGTGAAGAAALGLTGPWGWVALGSSLLKGLFD